VRRDGDQTGTLTLPAKKLFEIVNALPDTEIRIQEDKGGKSVTITADRFEVADADAAGQRVSNPGVGN
jgi:DNA polymerase III sliding clamp (beta) subunit (PCNA family)